MPPHHTFVIVVIVFGRRSANEESDRCVAEPDWPQVKFINGALEAVGHLARKDDIKLADWTGFVRLARAGSEIGRVGRKADQVVSRGGDGADDASTRIEVVVAEEREVVLVEQLPTCLEGKRQRERSIT